MAAASTLPIFFIIGRPRSGTTLLRTLFDAHPNVNIPLECAFINNLFNRYGHLSYFDSKTLDQFLFDLKKQQSIGFWKPDWPRIGQALSDMDPHCGFAGACKTVIATFQSEFPKEDIRLLGDKNPVYAFYTARLARIFPEARFIIITRDYRDHVASLLKLKIPYGSIVQVVWQWKWALKKNMALVNRFPDRFHHIRYEDFVTAPEEQFRIMTNFLGLPYREQVFDFHRNTAARDRMYSPDFIRQWQQNLFEPISSNNAGKWRTTLNKQQVCEADATAGRWADRAGYQREYIKVPASVHWKVLSGSALATIYNVRRILRDRLIFRTDNAG